jgi:pyruvate/2-oxoglutarate/acetoin dehydrogenase E1 component
MKSAIRDDDCVLFFEHKYLYRRIKAEMPSGDHVVPIGKARLAREGKDVSIITYAATVWKALEAAEQLEKEDGISVEVIDLRTLAPLDDEAIFATFGRRIAFSCCTRTRARVGSQARSRRGSTRRASNGSTRRCCG